MKQSIKIGLIVFTAIAIVGLLFYFTKKIDNAEIERIEPQSFVKYIEHRVNEEVRDKPFEQASLAFYELIGEINTESFVWLNDSVKALSASNIDKCRRQAFYAYAPIFISHGNAYFNKQSWMTQEADAIRDEANLLLGFNIVERGTQVKNDLDQLVKNVKEYHEALAVVKKAPQCGTIDEVNKSISNAKKYKHEPLTNNRKLQADLKEVPTVAKDALVSKLISRSSSLISRKCSYRDYTQWYEAYKNMVGEIEAYESAFGKTQRLTSEKTRLEQADEVALNCYD